MVSERLIRFCVVREQLGDYVDIKVNAAQQKGMPYLAYQGRTGKVWNITKRGLGVELNKKVGGRIFRKRINVRIEHVQPSRCREDFLNRRNRNEELKVLSCLLCDVRMFCSTTRLSPWMSGVQPPGCAVLVVLLAHLRLQQESSPV